jgi:PAS domain S-box-containing protein
MGARIRAFDWLSSPLGAPDRWHPALKTLAGLMLASRQPMFIAWGQAQIWLYNDAFTPIMGAKHPHMLGRPALAEVWSEARVVLDPLFRRVFAGEPVHMDDFGLMLERNGRLEEAHFAFSYTPVRDDDGTVAGLFGACIEITDQVVENRRKDEFLATLAHELRNPLAPLRNALLLARHGGQSGNEALQGMMERQVNHMVRLVDDLLDIARISQGKIELRLAPVDLTAVVDLALETTGPAVRQAGQSVAVTSSPSRVCVKGDALRLAQVVGNLINNAVKFSHPGGTIRVAIAQEGAEAIVRVSDDGIGIPPDKLEEVFEMFAQLDRTLERSGTGLGLGLPLARQLVRMHGGSIAAQSAGPGRGSEFVMRLAAIEPVEVAPEPPPRPATAPSRRILIADDNRDAADSMGMLLSAVGHEVEIVYDGFHALEAARRLRPEVMLIDIGMPRLNGYEVARTVRLEPWSARTVIIALTGWAQESDKQRSRDAGIDHHLTKPVEFTALDEAVSGLSGRAER